VTCEKCSFLLIQITLADPLAVKRPIFLALITGPTILITFWPIQLHEAGHLDFYSEWSSPRFFKVWQWSPHGRKGQLNVDTEQFPPLNDIESWVAFARKIQLSDHACEAYDENLRLRAIAALVFGDGPCLEADR
jgi:hypothetical protein